MTRASWAFGFAVADVRLSPGWRVPHPNVALFATLGSDTAPLKHTRADVIAILFTRSSLRPGIAAPQIQLHIQRSRHWILAIGSNLPKTHPPIHADCVLHHRLDCIQPQTPIPDQARLLQNL